MSESPFHPLQLIAHIPTVCESVIIWISEGEFRRVSDLIIAKL
jgi:hypothetical protein